MLIEIPADVLAHLTEAERDLLSAANYERGLSTYSRFPVAPKKRHEDRADAFENTAKQVRELIEKHAPRPALRLVLKEAADVSRA